MAASGAEKSSARAKSGGFGASSGFGRSKMAVSKLLTPSYAADSLHASGPSSRACRGFRLGPFLHCDRMALHAGPRSLCGSDDPHLPRLRGASDSLPQAVPCRRADRRGEVRASRRRLHSVLPRAFIWRSVPRSPGRATRRSSRACTSTARSSWPARPSAGVSLPSCPST